jgi:predicted PurR-regulated permease PerM
MEQNSAQNTNTRILHVLQYFVLICLILYLGRTLFIPLSFAVLISFLLFPVSSWMENKGMPRVLAVILPGLLAFLFLGSLAYLLFAQLAELTYEWSDINNKVIEGLQNVSVLLADNLGLSADKQSEIIQNIAGNAGNKIFSLLGSAFTGFTDSFVFLILTPIFSFLILLYRNKLVNTLYFIFPKGKRESIYKILKETILTYYNFAKGMLLVYFLVGILNSAGLAIIGVPHALLFGFTAAILTFIPYIGIMIGALLPVVVVWVTQNSIWYPIAVLFVFGIVQLLEAYLIFPLAVGKRLKINTLVVFIMIISGGMLWGAAGMILFIPMISIVKLVADNTPSLHYLSELLGD